MLSVRINEEESITLAYVGIDIEKKKIVAGADKDDILIEIKYSFEIENIFEKVRGFDIDIKSLQEIKEYNHEEETIGFFYNEYYEPDKVLDLRIKAESCKNNGNIGYFFHIEKLQDAENNHDLAPFPTTFLYRSILGLLFNINNFAKKEVIYTVEILKLTDFYTEDLIICCISASNLENKGAFFLKHYYPNLYKYGFYAWLDLSEKVITTNLPLKKKNYAELENYVSNITKSTIIADNLFFETLLTKIIAQNQYFIARFLLLYQVFEILKDKVLQREISLKVCDVINRHKGHKLREIINEMATDKVQISLLINKYVSRNDNDIEEGIKKQTIKIIKAIDPDFDENGKDIADMIYRLRNIVIHAASSLYEMPNYEREMTDFNQYFEYYIIHVIETFDVSKK